MNPRPLLLASLAFTSLLNDSVFAQTNAINSTGNVGIGTTSPESHLHVKNTGAVNLLLDQSPDGGRKYSISSRWGGYFTIWDETHAAFADAPRFAINPGNGGVGIGTLFPYGSLHVVVKSPYGLIGNHNAIALSNSNATAWNATSILNFDSSNTGIANAAIDFLNHNHGGATGVGSIRFYTKKSDSGLVEAMQITPSGYVGIGTNNPSGRLTVSGAAGDSRSVTIDSSEVKFRGDGIAHMSISGPITGKPYLSIGQTSSNFPPGSPSTEAFVVNANSNVGIGTTNPTHKLAVNGTIKAKEVIVETTGWSDYVFADDYTLAPLAEVEAHIKEHKHLPGIPSAAQVAANGVSLGEVQSALLAKVEELTLHLIAQQKELAALKHENAAMKARFEQLEAR